MAVLLGILNGKKEDIGTMYDQVKHRGDQGYQEERLLTHFVATARAERDKTMLPSSGIYRGEDGVVAVAGAVTDEDYNGLSPQQLYALFQQEGIDFVRKIEGAFVMAILTKKKLYLIRDATGQRTVYYNHQGNRLAFCIEQKGIHALPYYAPQINTASIFKYFTYSFIPMEDTMLKGIKELPAGCLLHYDLEQNTSKVDRYFKLENIEKHHHNDLDYWVERIRKEVNQEIDYKLQNQQEVGVFLSGGLDSSIIAAQVAKRHTNKVHTFSIHFGKEYLNELDFAKMVADRYKTVHHEVAIKPKNFIPKMRQTIWHLDDPIGDPITIPNFELAKYAADYVPIIFNGEGGDPCFGGPKNIPMLLGHWYGGIVRPTNFREKAYLASYRRGYKHLQQLLSPELLQEFDEEEHLESILSPFFKEPNFDFLDKLMSINIRLKGAHLILPKVERMLGASKLPAIAPLFTKAITRSSMEMPANFKLNRAVEKYILKETFKDVVPTAIINRPKSGMRVPVRYWFQGDMKKYARKLLDTKEVKKAGIFNPKTIKSLLSYDTETGLDRHGLLTWMVLSFELWRQLFIENKSA